MKSSALITILAACLLLATACQQTAHNPVDLTKVKAEIQTIENAWANALNNRDLDALMSMYAEDAISMSNNAPMLVGKEAIRKNQEQEFSRAPDGISYSFEVMDIYGDANTITETGTATYKDATGNTLGTGKYMVVWEKKDGNYLCVREIYNGDKAPEPSGFKSLHLLDLPAGVTEADLAATLNSLNKAIEGQGYPGAGYFLYKTENESVKNYRYFFEGVWPNETAYNVIHDSEEWKKASEAASALNLKISAVEIYRKMVRVE